MSSSIVDNYYAHARPELHELVPAGARRLLDVGCAGGAFGTALRRSHADLEVWGVEVNPEAAETAKQTYDRVLVGAFPDALDGVSEIFDCITFNDVLEHMYDPWTALAKSRDLLSVTGIVVVSLPNICSVGVIRQLIRGEFNYEDSGVLDRTHVRFFTPKTALHMFEGAGFRVLHTTYSWPHLGRWAGRLLHSTFLGKFNERQMIFVLGQ